MTERTWAAKARPAVFKTGHPGAAVKMSISLTRSVKREETGWCEITHKEKLSERNWVDFYLCSPWTARAPKYLLSSVSGLRFLSEQRKTYLECVCVRANTLFISDELCNSSLHKCVLFSVLHICIIQIFFGYQKSGKILTDLKVFVIKTLVLTDVPRAAQIFCQRRRILHFAELGSWTSQDSPARTRCCHLAQLPKNKSIRNRSNEVISYQCLASVSMLRHKLTLFRLITKLSLVWTTCPLLIS